VKLNYQFNDYSWQWGRVSNEEAEAPIIGDNTTSKQDILDELNLEDEGKDTDKSDKDNLKLDEDEEEDEGDDKEKSDKEDEDEEEIEIKEPGEEEEERLVVPAKKAEILKKYPTLEKEFPSLFAYYYKAQQYTDILPTIADAKAAAKDRDTLQNFRADLEKGETVKVIEAIKNYSPENYTKFVDNYLQTLAAVDREAYFHVTNNVLANAIQFGLSKAKEDGDNDVKEAILIFNEFLFGQKEPRKVTRLSKEENTDESSKLKKEREDFENQKWTELQSDLKGKIDNQITATVDANIDKDNKMTPFVKRNAVREVKAQLDEALKNDKPFQSIISSLEKRAKADKNSRTALDKIKSAHLTQAKNYLQRIIPRVRNEALKGISVTRRQEEKVVHRNSTSSEPTNRGNKNTDSKNGRGMRTVDFFNT
jgi:hypothetical protein